MVQAQPAGIGQTRRSLVRTGATAFLALQYLANEYE